MKLARFPISALLDSASGQLEAHVQKKRAEDTAPTAALATPYSGIIFSGNPHETVPRKLLLDNRLTPLERNCWQVFRLLVNEDGITAFPTYDQLRPYLGMNPGKHASRETVAKALTVLRLTRWLSLGRTVRNEINGQVQGNVYLLHDEPVTPAEALEFDKDYMSLLMQSMEHQNKAIKDIAAITWREFTSDPDVGRRLPSRIDTISDRLNAQTWAVETKQNALPAPEFGIRTQQDLAPEGLSSESELSANSGKQGDLPLSSESELSQKPLSTPSVRNPNSASTYTNTDKSVSKSFVQPRESAGVNWLLALDLLKPEDRVKAREIMGPVPEHVREAVINQWKHRCTTGSVAKPLAYLTTLAGKAIRGDFNAEWNPSAPAATPPQTPPPARTVARAAQPPAQKPAPTATAMQTANSALTSLQALLDPRRREDPSDE
ncbi:STY4528 family pathogenicity island replication protein [Pseudomonas sp. Marseille-P8916]|uniref:STY4528 family pathogenicity island replication protein n=1 Tax=Pseudomonas sp. Marseille-P8916 TaxID=2866589 RepID=UPI001CE3DAC6|nr:STY4528 family pathogenicity island replication protein [Pseudomonas sp. Marseille-P8916]